MEKEKMISWLESREQELRQLASDVWNHPELALCEVYACQRQSSYLEENGFRISPVNGLSTAFVAEYGEGRPVIGMLGEYDALPGLSQKAVPFKEAVIPGGNGHGCGHNLIGVGGIGAALAVKEWMKQSKIKGTIRYFGCPAEERFGGKELMLHAGAFDGTDCCLSWHPESVNKITKDTFRAICDVSFRFQGTTSYTIAERELGGSAVSGYELLNIGVQFMRAHMTDDYIVESHILKGADASNVLPEVTEVGYALRADSLEECRKLLHRIGLIAEGAALMSGTTVEQNVTGSYYSNLYNETVGDIIYENMKLVEKQRYTKEELEFAEKIAETIGEKSKRRVIEYYHIAEDDCVGCMHNGAVKSDRCSYKASSDVGNVSWHMPVGMFYAAAGPMGMPMHTWQAAALCGTGVGFEGMMYAARVMAAAAFDLICEPQLVGKAWAEFNAASGDGE